MSPSDVTPPLLAYRWVVDATGGSFLLFAWVVAFVALGVFAALKWGGLRAAARAADEAASRTDSQLGPRSLRGYVRTGDGAGIVVSIMEKGKPSVTDGGQREIIWQETRRTVVADVFELVLNNELRVRVEPDERVQLISELVVKERTLFSRTREARLADGEAATVTGVLRRGYVSRAEGGGYRGLSEDLILGPPEDGRMVASVVPLGDLGRRRAKRHGHFAWVFGGALLLVIAIPWLRLGDEILLSVSGFVIPAGYAAYLHMGVGWYEKKRLSDSEVLD